MTDTKEIKEKLKNGEEVSISEIFSKNEQNDDLDKALDNLQTQIDKEAEEQRKAEEAKRKAEEERRERWKKEQEMADRFPEAVEENQVEEVKILIKNNVERGRYHWGVFSFPSTEMAEIIINDMRQVLAGDKYTNSEKRIDNCICETIHDHPENAAMWDKFAKDHDISYHFKTTERNVFDKVVEQGFDIKCYDFEKSADNYYNAKNGYVKTEWCGPHDDYSRSFWGYADSQEAAQIKEDLIYVLSRGYQIDLSEKGSKSYLFMQELLKERELQKQGVDKSFVYRDPLEEFYDNISGECRLSLEKLRFLTKDSYFVVQGLAEGRVENEKFSGSVICKRGVKKIEAQYKEGQLHGVYKELDANGAVKVEKYYENGVDVTEKRKILQRIADSKIRRDNNLKDKNLPKALEELGKAQIKFNSKIEAAFAVKKAQKEGRK